MTTIENNGSGALAKVSARDITPMHLLAEALQRGDAVETIARLMDLQERHERNEARKAYDAALADAKTDLPVLTKNRKVGFDSRKAGAARTSYRHADLAEIVRVIVPILGKHGLTHRFRTSSEPGQPIVVTCIIAHRSGYSEENTLRAGRDESGNKNAIQAIGSTVTYLSRYTLMAALGLAAADDSDGATSEDNAISVEQMNDLQKRLQKCGIDDKRFLARFELETLADLPERRLQEAFSAIAAYETEKAQRVKK